MKARLLLTSFNTGEVSPEMFGRFDLQKVQHALATARNMVVLPHGPADNRTGLEYVNEVKNSANFTRLVPFVFDTTQTFAIEMGAGYFRFHTQGETLLSGGVPYEVTNSYAAADLPAVKFVQSNDVMTFTHPSYPTMELKRLGATNWTFTQANFGSKVNAPTGLSGTANEPVTTNAHTLPRQYVVTALGTGTLEESLPSNSVELTNDLTLAGNTNSLSWTLPSGSIAAQNVYANISPGGVFGYVGQVGPTETAFTDANITPDFTQTPPTGNYDSLSTSGGYPAAVAYYQQRRAFGGSDNAPQTVQMTRSGTEYNLNFSIPVRQDDAIQFTVASREMNAIKHMVPLRSDLVLLTPDAEYQVNSPNVVITPSSVAITPFSYVGASDAPPAPTGNSVVYAQSRGGHVRELLYVWQMQGYTSNDLCLMATHLFDGLTVVDMAYCKTKYPIIWCVSDSGALLGLTYVPEQQVAAWHRHDTGNGDTFEACCSVIEGNEDILYVIVKRTINGAQVRYVERLVSRIFPANDQAFFVDAGTIYQAPTGTYTRSGTTLTATTTTAHGYTTGDTPYLAFSDPSLNGQYTVTVVSTTEFTITTATGSTVGGTIQLQVTTVSGLTWLEGCTVNVLADGAVHPQCVVTSGTINLQWGANTLVIGLPITSQFQTMPFAFLVTWVDRGQGRPKAVDDVWVRVSNTASFKAGPTFNDLVQWRPPTPANWGEAPGWEDGEFQIITKPQWGTEGQVCIQQDDPLPLTVVGATVEVSVGGG